MMKSCRSCWWEFLNARIACFAAATIVIIVFGARGPIPPLTFIAISCNPEPGAHHYPEPPKLPERPAGYWIAFRTINGFPEDDVTSVHGLVTTPGEPSSLVVAAGTRNNGIAVMTGADIACYTVENTDGRLPSNSVHDVLVVRTGGYVKVYAATSAGIAVHDASAGTFSEPLGSEETGLNALALSMCRDRLIYATDRGIRDIDGIVLADTASDSLMPVSAVPLSLASHDDKIFAGYEDTLWEVESGLKETGLPREENAVYVRSVHSSAQMLAAATVKGIMIRGTDGEWLVVDSRSGLPGDWVTAIWINENIGLRSLPFPMFDPFTGTPVRYLSGPSPNLVEAADGAKKVENYERLRSELGVVRDAAISAAGSGYGSSEFLRFQEKYNAIWASFSEAKAAVEEAYDSDSGEMGLWAGTGGQGLAILHAGGLSVLRKGDSPLTSDEITDIWYDAVAKVGLVATRDGGMLKYQRNAISIKPDPVKIVSGRINRLRTSGGTVYCCMDGQGLITVEPPRNTASTFPFPKNSGIRPPDSIWDVGFSSDKTMLLAAGKGGLFSWDGKMLIRMDGVTGEVFSGFRTIHCSESGATWLGLDSGDSISDCVLRLSPDGFLSYSREYLAKFAGMTGNELKAAVKGASRQGHVAELLVSKPDPAGAGNERFSINPAYDSTATGCGPVTAILEIEHLVLFGTAAGGMTCLKGGGFNTVTPNRIIKGGSIQSLSIDHTGSVLVASGRQAALFNGIKWTTFLLPPRYLGSLVNAFLPDPDSPGTLWLGLTLHDGTGAAVCIHENGDNEAILLEAGGVFDLALASSLVYMASVDGLYAARIR